MVGERLMRIAPSQKLESSQLGKHSAWCHAVGVVVSSLLLFSCSLCLHQNYPPDEPMVHPKLNSASGVFKLLTLPIGGKPPILSAKALVANPTKVPRPWQTSPAPPQGDPQKSSRSKSLKSLKSQVVKTTKQRNIANSKAIQGHPGPTAHVLPRRFPSVTRRHAGSVAGTGTAMRPRVDVAAIKGGIPWQLCRSLQHVEISTSKQIATPVLAASTFLHRCSDSLLALSSFWSTNSWSISQFLTSGSLPVKSPFLKMSKFSLPHHQHPDNS